MLQYPAALVDIVVVAAAQQGQVCEVGGAVVAKPLIEVVGLAPAGWTVAARPHTATVADHQGQALGWCNAVAPTTHIEWLRGTAHDHRNDCSLASQPAGGSGCQLPHAGYLTTWQDTLVCCSVDLTCQPREVYGDDHLGPGRT